MTIIGAVVAPNAKILHNGTQSVDTKAELTAWVQFGFYKICAM